MNNYVWFNLWEGRGEKRTGEILITYVFGSNEARGCKRF
jgi:hypothetical protein